METDRKEGVRLWELPRNSCHWPLGGPLEVVEFFCGAPAKLGGSYCMEHHRQAFVRPYNARKDKHPEMTG